MQNNAVQTSQKPTGAPGYSQVAAQGGTLIQPQAGSKFNPASLGRMFFGANPAGVTLSAALATTYVGLCLSNPKANTKNLSIRRVSGIVIVAPAGITALGIAVGFNATTDVTHTTPIAPSSSLVGSTAIAPTGLLDSSATLPTAPKWAQWLNAGVGATGQPGFSFDLEGGIVLPPGGYAIIAANITGPASGFLGSFEWDENAQ